MRLALATNSCENSVPVIKIVPGTLTAESALRPTRYFNMKDDGRTRGRDWDGTDSGAALPIPADKALLRASLETKLNALDELVKAGRLGRAFDLCGQFLKWHEDRGGSAARGIQREVCDKLWRIGTLIWSMNDQGAKWAPKLRQALNDARALQSRTTKWPFGQPLEDLVRPEKILALSYNQRGAQIETLIKNDFVPDAGKLAEWNYIVSRKNRQTEATELFDQLSYALAMMNRMGKGTKENALELVKKIRQL